MPGWKMLVRTPWNSQAPPAARVQATMAWAAVAARASPGAPFSAPMSA